MISGWGTERGLCHASVFIFSFSSLLLSCPPLIPYRWDFHVFSMKLLSVLPIGFHSLPVVSVSLPMQGAF